MATTYFLDAQGRMYSTAGAALNPADSQIPFVSAAGAAAITSTPTLRRVVEDACVNAAISAGTKWGQPKQYH